MFEAVDVEIRFDYDSPEAEDIRRCLNTLYSTREGSQPLPVAQQEYAFEVVRKTRVYEPRVDVKEVTYAFDGESGRMRPVVLLTKGVRAWG